MPFVNPKLHGTLKVIVEIAFGYDISTDPSTWTWTDVTKYVQGSVNMAAGAPDQASNADPARVSLMLANTDGRFTALNPASPYYPNVKRNVPLRVSMTWDGAASTYELLTVFVDGWPLQPNAGVINVTTPISASGRLRRMRNSSGPTRSAMVGSLSGYSAVRSYWALENNDLTSPIAGVSPASMQFGTWQSVSGFDGSDALPVFGQTAGFGADVAGTFTSTGWTVDWYMNFPTSYSGDTNIFQINMPSTSGFSYVAFSLITTLINVQTFDFFGNVLRSFTVPIDNSFFGTWQHFRYSIDRPSSPLLQTLTVTRLADGAVLTNGSSDVAGGLVPPASLQIVRSPNLNGTQFGQVVVFDSVTATAMDNAATGWTGELATDRVQRICDENFIPISVGALPASPPPQAMGPQAITNIATILQDCADVDNGILHDGGTSGSLVYNSGVLRYNAATAFALDFNRHQIGDGLAATYDDQSLVQQWTMTGANASATWLSPEVTDPHPDIYAMSGSVNVATAAQLMPEAQWRVRLGMVDAYRIPSISVDVRGRNPELAQAMTSLVLPSKISPTHLPSPYPPQSFDQFIEGWSAVVDAVTWQVQFNCSPAAPWRVFTLADSTIGRLDTAGSSLLTPVTNVGQVLNVVTGSGPQWTTDFAQFPFDINLGGEQCRVTSVTGGTNISRVGAFLSTSALGATDFNGALANWNSITGVTLNVVRAYQAQGDFSIGTTGLAQMVSAGKKICLTLRPDYNPVNPSHLTALEFMLISLQASGANVNVALWHEPFFSGLTAAQYVAMVRYYGPTVRKYFPLWFVCSGADADVTNGFYPGDAYIDGVAVDAYAASGTTQITNAQSIADNGGKPFGVWEFNGGADLGQGTAIQGQTQAAVTAHFQYIQNLFTARLAAGKPNGDLLLFSSAGLPNGSLNFLGTSLSANGGFETGLGNWIGGSAALAQTSAQAHSGTNSGQITAPGGGGTANILMCATGSITTQGLPCSSGQVVAAMGWFRSAVTVRSCRIDIAFFNSSGVAVSTITGGTITSSTSGWTSVVTSGTAPATTAFARIVPTVLSTAASEVHYFDDPEIAVLPATNDLTSPIQYPWDYRIALLSSMVTALDATSLQQQMNVLRSINGVQEGHPVGTSVSLWQPGQLAL